MARRRYYGRRRGGYGAAAYWRRKYQSRMRQIAAVRNQQIGAAGGRGSTGNIAFFGPTYGEADEQQKFNRRLYAYRGKGDYRDYLKWIPRGVGGAIGAAAGAYAGKNLNSAIQMGRAGWDTGAQLSKYIGWGAYDGSGGVDQNQLIDYDPSQKQISVNHDHNSGDIIFQHTEFIQNVVVNIPGVAGPGAQDVSTFDIQSFGLNPGLEGTFPFLAQIASNFSMYEFAGLMFQYKPTFGSGAGDTNALGKVIMATDYDPSAPVFTNAQAMENYDYAQSTRPSAGMHHGVETALSQRLTNQLYVRTEASAPGPSPQGQKDKVLTDLGLFQIATDGIAGPAGTSVIIGELWVTYKVKLSRASLRVNQALELANFDRFQWQFVTGSPGLNNGTITKSSYCSIGGAINGRTTTEFSYAFPRTVVAGTYLIKMTLPYQHTAPVWSEFNLVHATLRPIHWDTATSVVYTAPRSDLDAAVASSEEFTAYIQQGGSGATGATNDRLFTTVFMVEVLAHDGDQAQVGCTLDGAPISGGSITVDITQVNSNQLENDFVAV